MKVDKDSFEKLKELVKSETDLKVLEILLAKKQKSSLTTSPLFTLILSAIFGLIGTAYGAYIQGNANLDLEQKKFESQLVLQMIDSESQEQSAQNLKFLVDAGLIQDEEGLITQMAKEPTRIPKRIPVIIDQTASSDEGILKLMKNLTKLGYYKGPISVENVLLLSKPVKRFQKDHNMPADGLVGPATLRRIELETKKIQ